jgi:protein-S-isoprenylcysteine O-methyltransferase Ste14
MQMRDANSPAIELAIIQKLRKPLLVLATIVFAFGFVFIGSKWPDNQFVHEMIEWLGTALIVTCILGRTWTSLYISGRKDVTLVMNGPYSVSRNPLYFFSVLGAIGIGAQVGSLMSAVVVGLLVWALFELVVIEEEKTLGAIYGRAYSDYRARVPRFLPRFSQWQGNALVTVHIDRVVRTFIDACVFLVAIPVAELVEHFQDLGWIPILFRVP